MFDRDVFGGRETDGKEDFIMDELMSGPKSPTMLEQLPEKYNESPECTDDDHCSFYTYSVLELINEAPGTPLNEWSCGGTRYPERCKKECCDQQDEYCRIGGFAGFGGADSMQSYIRCMRERGCTDGFFSCDRNNGYDKTLNYDVPPNSQNNDLCGQYKQGIECAEECCKTQETYCKNNTNSLRVFFDCMAERGCDHHAKLLVHEDGPVQSKGCTMPKDFANEFDVPCFGEKCDFPCLTEKQGKTGCAKECCKLQHSYCRKNTAVGGMASYFKCMRMRGCGPVMSCSVTGGKTDWFSNDNFDFSYLVTPGDGNTHCGTHFQGSNACRDSCCQAQHIYCGDSNDHLRGYFQCMQDRSCLPYGKEKVHGSTWDQSKGCALPRKKNGGPLANPFDVPCGLDGKCDFKCVEHPFQGQQGCAKSCCLAQHTYCRGNNAINGMEGYFKCMKSRGCGPEMSCNTDGSKEGFASSDNYDFTYNVDPNDDNDKCQREKQGGEKCYSHCCWEQYTYCADSNDHLRGFFTCMSQRNCTEYAKEKVHGSTWDQTKGCTLPKKKNGADLANPFDVPCSIDGKTCEYKCIESWYQGKEGCQQKCCLAQHKHCRENNAINGMEGYFQCMRTRGCESVMSCSADGSKTDFFEKDSYDFTYNINPNDDNDQCGSHRQGKARCRNACCQEQHTYCADANFNLRGYFQCMMDRRCTDYAKIKVHGGQDQNVGCTLPKMKNGKDWSNPFDVPCGLDGTCSYKCEESWYQGKMGCANKCCKTQHDYCRANNAINGMEGYFKCMVARGCNTSISCNIDGSKNGFSSADAFDFTYNVTPNDNADKCGSERQHGGLCQPQCCEAQFKHCKDSNTKLRGFFQCMTERNCFDVAKVKIHGSTDQSKGCSIHYSHWKKPFDVPCGLDGKCDYQCDSTWQGSGGCADKCCAEQEDYCRNGIFANATMEGYFVCMRSRGCERVMSCEYDDSTNYDINPADASDHCGTYKQGTERCRPQCCDKQNSHCQKVGALHLYHECMRDRGCLGESKIIISGNAQQTAKCDWAKNFSVNPNSSHTYKCNGTYQGGSGCKKDCCSRQADFCGCGVNDAGCMDHRGCSLDAGKTASWGFLQGGTTWPAKCKKTDDSCVVGGDCANHDLVTGKGSQCCRGKCKVKKRDWIGAYYCPHEVVNEWGGGGGIGDPCTLGTDCADHGVGTIKGTACCGGKCAQKVQDYVGAWYCPSDVLYKYGGNDIGGPCALGTHCKGHGVGTAAGTACCDEECTEKTRDYIGAYYCPSEVKYKYGGNPLNGACELGVHCANHGFGTAAGTACCRKDNGKDCPLGSPDCSCQQKTKDWIGAYYCPGTAVNHPTTEECKGWKCNDFEVGTVCKDTYRCEQCALTSERRWVTMSNLYTGGSCSPETTDCADWTCDNHEPGTICTKEGGPFRCDQCVFTGKRRWVTVSNGYTGAEC